MLARMLDIVARVRVAQVDLAQHMPSFVENISPTQLYHCGLYPPNDDEHLKFTIRVLKLSNRLSRPQC